MVTIGEEDVEMTEDIINGMKEALVEVRKS